MTRVHGLASTAVLVLVVLCAPGSPAAAVEAPPTIVGRVGILGSGVPGQPQYRSPQGIDVAPDGSVRVADAGNQRVQWFSPAGERWAVWEYGEYPVDVAVGPTGNVYVAEVRSGTDIIRVYNPDGSALASWQPVSSVQSVDVAADGTVYVNGSDLLHYTSTGASLPVIVTPSTVSAVAAAPDGTVYTLQGNRVRRYSSTGTLLDTFGTTGSGVGALSGPSGLAVAPDGSVYVLDAGNHRVQQFSATGTFVRTWGSSGTGPGQIATGLDIDVGPGGEVYVTEGSTSYTSPTQATSRVQRFTAEGAYVGQAGTHGDDVSVQFSSPRGVERSASGSLFVADSGNDRVQRITPEGDLQALIGSSGSGPGELDGPQGVAVAPNGDVYVADTINDRVQRFTPDGDLVDAWGNEGSADGQFQGPTRLAIGGDGDMYVLDAGNSRVQRFTATGDHLGSWGSPGPGDGQFTSPADLAITPDGDILVAGTFASGQRFQRFTPAGSFVGGWSVTRATAPRGMVFDGAGMLWVADDLGVTRYTPEGAPLTTLDGLASRDVATGPDGLLHVTSNSPRHEVVTLHAATSQLNLGVDPVGAAAVVGHTLELTLTLQNTGAGTLTGVALSAPAAPDCTGPVGDLAPAEVEEVHCSHLLTMADSPTYTLVVTATSDQAAAQATPPIVVRVGRHAAPALIDEWPVPGSGTDTDVKAHGGQVYVAGPPGTRAFNRWGAPLAGCATRGPDADHLDIGTDGRLYTPSTPRPRVGPARLRSAVSWSAARPANRWRTARPWKGHSTRSP